MSIRRGWYLPRGMAPHDDLARHQLADLFLDTAPL